MCSKLQNKLTYTPKSFYFSHTWPTMADDDEDDEPRMQVATGRRRLSVPEVDASLSLKDLENLEITNQPSSRGLNRRGSSKIIKGGNQSESSVAGNFMQNIHSSPLQDILHYTAPVYPKSDKDGEFIEISLQRNFVFANALSDEETSRKREMKQIVDAFEPYTVGDVGVTILSAGSVGDYFYILKEGCIEYKNVNQRGNMETVGRAKRPGQSFGELCLLYDCPPPADCVSGPLSGGNVKCRDGSSCILWRLHKVTFRQIMAQRTMRRDEHLRDAIRKITEFEGLDDDFINRISNALDLRTVKRGEVIYEAGDKSDEFYVVGSDNGKVKITPAKGGKSVTIGSDETFGTDAIALHRARTETAKAAERTTLLLMSREHLNRTIGSLTDAKMLSNDRRLLKSIPLFRDSDFEDFEYELMAALIEKVTYRGGKVIYEEEQRVEEPALMIVRDGIFDLFSDACPDRERVLKEGDIFGEDSLLPDKNMKFGGAKGGTKYREETVEVVSDEAILGRLTLANIDSVVLDLHRLGCKRRRDRKDPKKGGLHSSLSEPRPESLGELEFHQLFGAGTFGRVWIVSKRGGGNKTAYALKIQSKRELLDQRQASSALRERTVMSKLDHPFVCRLVNTFQDDACIYMLQSLIQGGELLNLIQGGEMHGGLPEIATKFYAAGILEGLTYMHRRHIVYRDLKPENVLLDSDGYPVIIDFGFSKVITDKTYTFCGTPLYIAPEIVLAKGHDRGVDYWALGCLIYEMLFGATPFYERGIDQKGLFKNIVRGNWKLPGDKLSRHAKDLIKGMLAKRPTDRLGCLAGGYREVKDHPFFKEVNFNKLVKKQIKAPWVPHIENKLDISHFENFDDEDDDFTKGKKPLTADEQIVFQDF